MSYKAPLGFSPLLNWAAASGRIHESDRLAWAQLLGGPDDDEVVLELLDAQPDPTCGDFLPPLPWGIGDPHDAETVDTARVAAARGRKVLASTASGFTGALRTADVQARKMTVTAASSGGPDSGTGTLVFSDGATVDVPGPEGAAPTVFASGPGDVPLMTASGVDPSMLRNLPPQARPAAAAAETRAEVFAMFERYSGEDGHLQAEADAMPDQPLHASLADYRERVERWASTPVALEDDFDV